MNESVDKKIEYDDLQAYQGQQQLEAERLQKGLANLPLLIGRIITSIGATLLSRLTKVN